jgi:hypothetical protein
MMPDWEQSQYVAKNVSILWFRCFYVSAANLNKLFLITIGCLPKDLSLPHNPVVWSSWHNLHYMQFRY